MTVQIAVKLPDDVVASLDELVSEGVFPNRSAVVRHGLLVVLSAHRRQAIDRAYEDAYERLPETPQEMREATRLAAQAIGDEPWEKWW